MSTSFDEPYEVFFKKIENDSDFFNYYNLTDYEALELAKERALGYLKESLTKLRMKCTPDVNFNDYDKDMLEFNFNLTDDEIMLLGSLMFEMYLDKDISKLRVHETHLTSQDLNSIHSPANERKTFAEMVNMVRSDNSVLISDYASKDRITGKRKMINHSAYQ